MFDNIKIFQVFAISVLFLLAGLPSAGSAQPPTLTDPDPLRDGVPALDQPLVLEEDSRLGRQKLLGSLFDRVSAMSAESRLRVVVTLNKPVFDDSLRPPGVEDPELKTPYIAAAAVDFVSWAEPLGFEPVRAFTYFPVVIGDISAGAVETLADLPAVFGVREAMTYTSSRSEAGSLMRADVVRDQLGSTGRGIGVAVLDTGIDWTHPELAGKVPAQGDFTGTTGNGFDDQGHGTSVAGIVAGSQGGMAPNAKVWALKVLSASGSGSDASVLGGLQAVLANRNNFGGVHVVNMSLGGGGPFNSFCDTLIPDYTSIFQDLLNAGILVLVASGNEGYKNGIASPACHSRNVAVGAVYDANIGAVGFILCTDPTTAADLVTCYSNSGSPLDILAPSHCAATTRLGGGIETCFGGTSAATPYTAGVVAQLLSMAPATSPGAMLSNLVATGTLLVDPGNGRIRARVDAKAAADSLGAVIFADGFESGNTTAW